MGAESVIHVMRPGHIRGSARCAGRGVEVAGRAVMWLGKWCEGCCLVQCALGAMGVMFSLATVNLASDVAALT